MRSAANTPSIVAAQEASAIFRRKAIYEELHPETKAGTAGATSRWGGKDDATANFAAATADATGKAERTVRLAAARGEALGDDLGAVTGTSLDKGVELDALAKLPKDERKGLIDRAKAGANGRK
jgi:ParB family chromosome partitioning protein